MSHHATLRRIVPALFRPLAIAYGRLRPSIRILMYHRVTRVAGFDQLVVRPERFEEQMAHLARRHRVISLAQAVEELASGDVRPGVVVTFDDGYRDTLTHALPILRDYAIPATVFITIDFCALRRSHPRYPSARPSDIHLDWEGVRALKRADITIGSHTISHPHLPRLPAIDARREIVDSRRQIEEAIGTKVEFFCYPSGDFGKRELIWVREAGYLAAVSVAPGGNHSSTPLLALARTEVTDRDGAAELEAKLDGAYDPIHAVLHVRRRRAYARLALGA
jgi:peptidoglycan/xylan/chitin deacetylase (PgdA/CDA1 family)